MIHIPDTEKHKWESGRYIKELKLDFPDINLTLYNDSIYGESMVLKEGLFDGNGALEIFGCVSSCFSIEIRYPMLTPDSTLHPSNDLYPGRIDVLLKNQLIVVSIRINEGTWRQLFKGYVDSIDTVKNRSYQKLQCYDRLHRLIEENVYSVYDELGDTFTAKALRDAIFNYIGIQQVTQDLPNDSKILKKKDESGTIAFIEAAKEICRMNGRFGIMNREDKFEYRKLSYWYDFLPYPSDDIFPSNNLFPGEVATDNHEYIDAYESIRYEDYEVACIDKVVIRDSSSDDTEGSFGSGTNVYVIEGNKFLEGLDQIEKSNIAADLLYAVSDITYQPFDAVSLGRPYIEVGDAVSYYVYDYTSGEASTDVMTFNILMRTLKGLQWLRDEYSASGEEYQPAIKIDENSEVKSDINNIKSDIGDINDKVGELFRDKQNLISLDILEPTWDASDADLLFHDNPETGYRDMWRYDTDHWVKCEFDNRISFIYTDDDDIIPGQSPLATGQIIFVYE